jgi:hypothetical protein
MQEKKIIEIKNKVETVALVLQNLINEIEYLKTMTLGSLAVMKKMPDYKEAMDKVIQENNSKKDELEQ